MAALPVDYHLHTNNTADGQNTLIELAERAASLDIKEIAVTDHYVPGIDGYCIGPSQIEQHFKDADTIKKRFGLTVRIGIEADYFPTFHKKTVNFINSFDFDYILGGAHFVDGFGLADENSAHRYFEKYKPLDAYCKYLEHLQETIESGLFDIMAHLDIVRKFGCAMPKEPEFEEYGEQAEAVARALIRTCTGFEVNCRGFDTAQKEQYPSADFLKLLQARGIDKVTLGSDAHWTGAVGEYLDRGLKALGAAGFTRICLFSNRTSRHVDIPDAYA